MTVQAITARIGDDQAEATLVLPDADHARLPLVVFYPDAGGLRPTMTAMGERLASHGYAVLEINPYWRHGPYEPFDVRTVFGDPAERARLMALMNGFDTQMLVADTLALIAAIPDARVARDRFATMGYCMGGRIAFLAATMLGERVAATAAIHAGGLVSDKPDSPHHAATSVRAALYLGVADEDASCTPAHQDALREALDAASVRYQLEVYPGARHGFAVPDFPVYDQVGAERHWERVLALFAAHLPR